MLKQAQQNLGSAAQIEKIVIDRGYLDGADLWSVHTQGIIFVICGKSNMSVTQDAQGVAKGERAVVRERVVRRGQGKTAKDQRLRTELVGVEALTSYDQYGDAQYTQNASRSDYVGQPINAVVVRKWENREPKSGGTVYLTNASVRDPFEVFDTYDWRSVIENGIFKEGKHPWHLLNFPKRNEAAVVVHCSLTLLVMGLTTAFRLWQAQYSHRSLCPNQSRCQFKFRFAWRGRHRTLAQTLTRRKPRHNHRFHRRTLWDFLSRGIRCIDSYPHPHPSLPSWHSTGRSSPVWDQPLILISKRQSPYFRHVCVSVNTLELQKLRNSIHIYPTHKCPAICIQVV